MDTRIADNGHMDNGNAVILVESSKRLKLSNVDTHTSQIQYTVYIQPILEIWVCLHVPCTLYIARCTLYIVRCTYMYENVRM